MEGDVVSETVVTTHGPVRGVDAGGVLAFRGVPYGAPTSGANRFRAPQPVTPWRGTRDCAAFGPSCPQMTVEQMLGIPMPPETEGFMGTLNYERQMSEDCLALNVFVPPPEPGSSLPVLVWLHGGGWSTGSASWPLYEFTNLAERGRVVVVSVNHRVGILGFLDLSSLDPTYADSGNAGMLDVVAALAWVRDNIAAFGGDPSNVTVFGESGGGAKVATLLAMPAAQGLFHKAVAISGSMLTAQTPDDAVSDTDWVLDHLDAAGIDEVIAADVGRLIDAEIALPGRSSLGFGRRFAPVLGPSLPRHPADALRAGLSADVTLVSGCNRDEMMAFLYQDPDLWNLDETGLRTRLAMLGADAERVLAGYRAGRPHDSPTSLLIAITTDLNFRVPQVRLAEAHVEGGGTAFMYLFTWGFEDPHGVQRSSHGLDMPFLFDNLEAAPVLAGPHADPLVAAMSGSLVSLAHTGSPAHDGLPDWPTYGVDHRATMLLGLDSVVELDPLGADRRCWDGIHLAGLGPRPLDTSPERSRG